MAWYHEVARYGGTALLGAALFVGGGYLVKGCTSPTKHEKAKEQVNNIEEVRLQRRYDDETDKVYLTFSQGRRGKGLDATYVVDRGLEDNLNAALFFEGVTNNDGKRLTPKNRLAVIKLMDANNNLILDEKEIQAGLSKRSENLADDLQHYERDDSDVTGY